MTTKKKIFIAVVIIAAVAATFALGGIKVNFTYKHPEKFLKNCDSAFVVTENEKTELTNEDAEAIKQLIGDAELKIVTKDPDCGFVDTFALEFADSSQDKTVVVYPADDGSNIIKIKNSLFEISESEKLEFYSITEKYGMSYPN